MTSSSVCTRFLLLFLFIFFAFCISIPAIAANSEKSVIERFPSFADIIPVVKEVVHTKKFDLLKRYMEKNSKPAIPYWLPESQDEPEDITYDQFISNMQNISKGAEITMTGKYDIWKDPEYPAINIETIGWRGSYKIVHFRFSYSESEKVWTLMGIYLTNKRMK